MAIDRATLKTDEITDVEFPFCFMALNEIFYLFGHHCTGMCTNGLQRILKLPTCSVFKIGEDGSFSLVLSEFRQLT